MQENRLVTIDELEKGDEILIGSFSEFRYLKLLQTPKKRLVKSTGYSSGGWKAVKCSLREDSVTQTYTRYNGTPYTRVYKKRTCTPDNHNVEKYQDLNGRDIWLVKKAII